MDRRCLYAVAMSIALSCGPRGGPQGPAGGGGFRLEEATIGDVQRAIRAKQITATQVVELYVKRIATYDGACVKGDVDPATGFMLGDITPIANARKVGAYITINVRGQRSKTDKADRDPQLLDALDVARQQDAYFARTGKLVGPLHGIPIAIKDNMDTADMRTTAGAAADYANDRPPRDATIVAKLRAAGAILVGKTNLDEYAAGVYGRSAAGGQTCNPYDTRRIAGGSSSGSAAAVAANLAVCALGSDTVGSVRYPAAVTNVVGLVATQGLVSRAGIFPLTFSRDRAGPLCRTVRDTAIVLEAIAGLDPRDSATAVMQGRAPVAYHEHAERMSLAGMRLGVVRDFMIAATTADTDSVRLANAAIADLQRLGATIVDPVDFAPAIAEIMSAYEPGFMAQNLPADAAAKPIDRLAAIANDPKTMPAGARGINLRVVSGQQRGQEARYALDLYLKQRGDAKFKTVENMLATKSYAGNAEILAFVFGATQTTLDSPNHTAHTLRIQSLQRILYKVMADNRLDALVYAYSTVPAPLIMANREGPTLTAHTEPRTLKAGTQLADPKLVPGEPTLKTDLDTWRAAGGSWGVNLSAVSGFPAIVVPAGFTKEVFDRVADPADPKSSRLEGPTPAQLPVAIELLARPFDEARLFEIASAYEAGTHHRRPPPGFQ